MPRSLPLRVAHALINRGIDVCFAPKSVTLTDLSVLRNRTIESIRGGMSARIWLDRYRRSPEFRAASALSRVGCRPRHRRADRAFRDAQTVRCAPHMHAGLMGRRVKGASFGNLSVPPQATGARFAAYLPNSSCPVPQVVMGIDDRQIRLQRGIPRALRKPGGVLGRDPTVSRGMIEVAHLFSPNLFLKPGSLSRGESRLRG
jgi:hypothetical protein